MRARQVAIVLGLLLGCYALLRVANLAEDGRQPLIKWKPAFAALGNGDDIYAPADVRGEGEGYPTPPFTALLLRPFLALGDVAGCVAFALLKLALAAWMAVACGRLAARAGPPLASGGHRFPDWGWLILVLLWSRVALSDVVHGNTNMLVAATLVAALVAWERRLDALSGFWIGLGAVLKLTPALFVLFYLAKRSRDGLIGMAAGVVLFGLAIPGAVLGFGHHLTLLKSYAQQMIVPFAIGAEPGPMQAMQLNQSLLGVATRLLSPVTAIEAREGVWAEDVSVNVVELSPGTIVWIVRALSLVVIAVAVWTVARRHDRAKSIGEFAMLALAMLMVSERSWKHHFVPVVMALAFLIVVALRSETKRARIAAWIGLSAWLLGSGMSGSGFLGDRGSDLAEAYGAYLIAAAALFVGLVASVGFNRRRQCEHSSTAA